MNKKPGVKTPFQKRPEDEAENESPLNNAPRPSFQGIKRTDETLDANPWKQLENDDERDAIIVKKSDAARITENW
jgi:hypothetical protein